MSDLEKTKEEFMSQIWETKWLLAHPRITKKTNFTQLPWFYYRVELSRFWKNGELICRILEVDNSDWVMSQGVLTMLYSTEGEITIDKITWDEWTQDKASSIAKIMKMRTAQWVEIGFDNRPIFNY